MKSIKGIFLLSLLLSFLFLPAQAQNIKVNSFRLLENDLTANSHGSQQLDQNGELSALIKVVTPTTGFIFDGGSLGIVAIEPHEGELWVYVPRRAQRLTIGHRTFGMLRDYQYPLPIEGGRTYELLLDIGTGVFSSIVAQQDKADVYIDGEYAGQSPVYNRYLTFGTHQLRAVKGMYEGETQVEISVGEKNRVLNVPMQDQSAHYGNVTLTVANNADIYVDGKRVGNGTYKAQMREGTYTVVTKKADCDDATTSFTVKPRQQNDITVTPPTPHMGYLRVYTRPQSAKAVNAQGEEVNLSESHPLVIGSHQFTFQRKGYLPENREYTIMRDKLTEDTVQLQMVSYFKDIAFYFGGGVTVRNLMGASGIVGLTLHGHDLQLSYTFGLGKSGYVNIYDMDWVYQSTNQYKMRSMAVKYGYQLNLTRRLAMTPQVGIQQNTLSASVVRGSLPFANGASATCVTLGIKMLWAPLQHLYVFAAPEFDVATKKDDSFITVSDASNFTPGGFAAHIGLLATF